MAGATCTPSAPDTSPPRETGCGAVLEAPCRRQTGFPTIASPRRQRCSHSRQEFESSLQGRHRDAIRETSTNCAMACACSALAAPSAPAQPLVPVDAHPLANTQLRPIEVDETGLPATGLNEQVIGIPADASGKVLLETTSHNEGTRVFSPYAPKARVKLPCQSLHASCRRPPEILISARTPGAASVPYAIVARAPCEVPATTIFCASTWGCFDMKSTVEAISAAWPMPLRSTSQPCPS